MPKAFSTPRMLARVWPMEQMPQIRPQIQGALSQRLPTSMASKKRGVSTTSQTASLSSPASILIRILPWPSTRVR